LFGDDINKAFPVAIADIQEVGNCIAAGLYTAAVFHLMRVANIGLREIARHWGVSKIGTKELEYCRDEQIISEIERLIEARLKAAATQLHDEKWEAETKLYRGLMLDCRYFKDVDRDGTMHARNSYKKPGAMDVYAHVRDFMQRASKIK
jgi:hypothetical protein